MIKELRMEAPGGLFRMVEKLFILGMPGSGKSAIARFILKYVNGERNDQCWSAIRFNDYAILLDMFHQDKAGKRFKPAHPSGFDVHDLKVFDEALQNLEREVNSYIGSLDSKRNELILIEFSRNDYDNAFRQFNESFLKDAYFLYLDTELEKCKQRICHRSVNPENLADDYPVSKYILEEYYHTDDWTCIIGNLVKDFGVDLQHIWTFYNNRSYDKACMEVEPFIEYILETSSQEKGYDLENPPDVSAPKLVLDSPQTSPDESGSDKQPGSEVQRASSEKQLAGTVS